jgi:hypothetical protein
MSKRSVSILKKGNSRKSRRVVDLYTDSSDEEREVELGVGTPDILGVTSNSTETPIAREVQEYKGRTVCVPHWESEETDSDSEITVHNGDISPFWKGYFHAFLITQEEFGFLFEWTGKEFTTSKQRPDSDLYTEYTFGVFEDFKDNKTGYSRYVLSTRFLLTFHHKYLNDDSILLDKHISFKLIKYQTNIKGRVDLTYENEHYQNWLNQQFWTFQQIRDQAQSVQAPVSSWTIIHNHLEIEAPSDTGTWYI